jgi:hypothetical protein
MMREERDQARMSTKEAQCATATPRWTIPALARLRLIQQDWKARPVTK